MTTSFLQPSTAPSADGSVPVGHIAAPSPRFGYLPTLDGWRAVAILLVLLAHGADSIRHALPTSALSHLALLDNFGWFGVQIFFALSEFLICARLLNERQTNGRIDLRQFYVRRLFRILPAAMTYLLLVGVLAVCKWLHFSFQSWLVTVLCVSNYIRPGGWYLGHFWSLAVEEHFYLLWPALLIVVGNWRRGILLAFVMAVAVALWRGVSFRFDPPTGTFVTFMARTDLQADGLLWGCLLAFLYVHGRTRDRLSDLLRTPGWLVAVTVLVASALLTPHDWKLRQITLVLFRVSAPLVIVGTVLHPAGIAGRLLESRPFKLVGKYSYSIYLWQQLFLVTDGSRVRFLGAFQSLPLNLIGVAGCAWLSYACVERPLIRVGHRLTSKATSSGSRPQSPAMMPVEPALI